MADISKTIGTLTETVKAIKVRVHEVEQTTVDQEARLQDIEKKCKMFKNDNKALKAQLEMLESHSNQSLFVTFAEYNRRSRPYSEILTYRLKPIVQ